jgi:hypothetical protein
MDHVNELAAEQVAPGVKVSHSSRKLTSASVGTLLIIVALLGLIWDFSEVLLAPSRRARALELLTPGMRITQAERTLNGAGYLTLYIDQTPPYLQVSTLSDPPQTARALHKLFPGSAPDTWLREQLTVSTRFYVKSDATGQVQFTPAGAVDTAPAPPPDVRADLLL